MEETEGKKEEPWSLVKKGAKKSQTLRDQGQAKQLIVSGLEQIVHLSDLTFLYRCKNRILTVGWRGILNILFCSLVVIL